MSQSSIKSFLVQNIANNNNQDDSDDLATTIRETHKLQKQLMLDVKSLNSSLNNRLDSHDTKLQNLNKKQKQHDIALNSLEQVNLNPYMVITGLKLDTLPADTVDCTKEVCEYLTKSEFTFSPFHIVCARVVKFKTKKGPDSNILVKFQDEFYKKELMKQKHNKPPVYFNHHLTKHNRTLLMAAKKLKRNNKLSYVAALDGSIKVKRNEGSKRMTITSIDQLNRFVNSESDFDAYSDDDNFIDCESASPRDDRGKKRKRINKNDRENKDTHDAGSPCDVVMTSTPSPQVMHIPQLQQQIHHNQHHLQNANQQ
jgi:hypothetical protein